MTLLLTEAPDGAVAIGLHSTDDGRPAVDTPAYQMAVYLLAASRHAPSWTTNLPRVATVDVLRLSQGRVFRVPVR